MSPLLGTLLQAGDANSANLLALKSWIALDALYRGRGTGTLLTLLCQQLLVSEELCIAGFQKARLASIREAHAALVRLDGDAKSNIDCEATGADYESLRDALVVYDAQLRSAPRLLVRDAQLATANRLFKHLSQPKEQ
ncbi:hypothetical protein QCE73_32105 [Caballeronia sp. LZ029]|uniref:hypothetical protein n=1 Tax=Caballeronia sp. LZ029 TaxID=3038564 RepID=UPI0028613BE0|nr:hypothetical protein [Caballeronia sp. LZ029]MDR5747836.1 hypothetical protein [Caballeronia sp. LZ029]